MFNNYVAQKVFNLFPNEDNQETPDATRMDSSKIMMFSRKIAWRVHSYLTSYLFISSWDHDNNHGNWKSDYQERGISNISLNSTFLDLVQTTDTWEVLFSCRLLLWQIFLPWGVKPLLLYVTDKTKGGYSWTD